MVHREVDAPLLIFSAMKVYLEVSRFQAHSSVECLYPAIAVPGVSLDSGHHCDVTHCHSHVMEVMTSDGEGDGLILCEKHDLISPLQNQLKLNSGKMAK